MEFILKRSKYEFKSNVKLKQSMLLRNVNGVDAWKVCLGADKKSVTTTSRFIRNWEEEAPYKLEKDKTNRMIEPELPTSLTNFRLWKSFHFRFLTHEPVWKVLPLWALYTEWPQNRGVDPWGRGAAPPPLPWKYLGGGQTYRFATFLGIFLTFVPPPPPSEKWIDAAAKKRTANVEQILPNLVIPGE